MKTIVLLLFAGATIGAAPTVKDLLPTPDFEPGWVWEIKPVIYKPDNLFEYNNGEAELYIDYDFVEMATLSLVRKDDDMAGLTVDIYDVGTPLDAFGLYSNFRRPDMTFDEIGEQAIVSDLNIRFYKGRFFVQLNIVSLKPEVKAGMFKLAKLIAEKIPAAEKPQELSKLPQENQIPNSMKYIKNGYLGQAAFTDVLEAGYHVNNEKFDGFVILFQSEKEAGVALTAFRDNMVKQDNKIEETTKTGLTVHTPYHGNIILVRKGKNICGVSGYKNRQDATALLETF